MISFAAQKVLSVISSPFVYFCFYIFCLGRLNIAMIYVKKCFAYVLI